MLTKTRGGAKEASGNTGDFKSFHYLESGDVWFSNYKTVQASEYLLSGVYKIDWNYRDERIELSKHEDGELLEHYDFKEKVHLDELFNAFFNKKVKEQVAKVGFVHKLGVLLYGKEGTGKTSILKRYYHKFIKEQEAIVFILPSHSDKIESIWNFIKSIRAIQDHPIVVFLDEVDSLLKESYGEALVKRILDGNLSIDNCIFLAATNYIDELPDATKRASRFKYILEVGGVESEAETTKVVRNILGGTISEEKVAILAKEVKGLTLDNIKHKCLDRLMDLTYKPKKESGIGFKKS